MSTATPEDLGIRPGDVLGGKLRVNRFLGRGGMAVVVAATHVELQQEVAVKVLLPELANRQDVVARFVREARAAVKIKGEHVVRVSDVGRLDSGTPYMVMEYLDGRDLHDVITERPVDARTACDYVLQACEALASAHALGIVHRDLKPSNLFLVHREDGSPCVKVLDFGISKVTDPSAEARTHTSTALGTPLYMSPEQMTATHDVDARADIWAIGITLHELMAGEPPFAGESIPQLCASVLQSQPRRLRERVPEAPAGLEAVVLRCLEKDPARRYANVAELAFALAPFAPESARRSAERVASILGAPSRGAAATPARTPVSPVNAGADTLPASDSALSPPPGPPTQGATQAEWDHDAPALPIERSRLPRVLAAFGAIAVVGALLVWRMGSSPSQPIVVDVSDSAATAAPVERAPASNLPAAVPPPPAESRTPIVDVAPAAASASATPHAPSASAATSRKPPPRPSSTAASKPAGSSDPYSKRSW